MATFRIDGGEHDGRRVWANYWLTAKALPHTKRGLARLGIVREQQLRNPPLGARVKLRVALRTKDDGDQYNEVKDAELISPKETQSPIVGSSASSLGGSVRNTPPAPAPTNGATAFVPDDLEV